MDLRQEVASAVVQAIPAATVIGAQAAGLTLPEWAAVAAIAFIVLQAVLLVWVRALELKKLRSKER